MKKFFSLVLALVMALSLTTVAWGAPGTEATPLTANDEASLNAAIAEGGYIKLTADIPASNIITIDKAVTLDGDKGDGTCYTLTSTAGRAINIDTTGEVVIKNLTVSSSGERAFNVINKAATLKVTNVTATTSNYALMVATSAGAANVAISDSNLTGKNVINVAGAGAQVTVTDSTINCNGGSTVEGYAALYLHNTAVGAKITATGCTINVAAPEYSKVAVNTAADAEILINGSANNVEKYAAYIEFGNNTSYSFASVADAVEYAVTKMGADENTEVEIIVTEYAVNNGESYTPATGVKVTPPAGAELVDDGTGNMTVAPAGTSGSAAAFGTKFYESDDAATKNWRLVGSFPGETIADFLVEADYEDGVGGNIEYYDVNGVAYVEATKNTGAYKLTCGKTEVYLNVATVVEYEAEAEVFTGLTTDEEACGSVLVSKKNLTKTYYAATLEINKVEYTYYFVADKTGGAYLLVDNKIVRAEYIGDDFSGGAGNAFIAHDWAGNDVDKTTKAYTTVKCENCGKVAKLYANADAAGKGAEYLSGFGWITKADAGYDVVVPSTPSTDKVTSADTFDAGIAMYVGMSVMAAAGSAVVIGKKKD